MPNFTERLVGLLPGLAAHGCSYQMPGGFVRRLHEGTWLGHVIEHVALELQTLAGAPVTRGKTRSVQGRPGVYNILYTYRDEHVGVAAGAHAIRMVASLLPDALGTVEGLEILGTAPLDNPQDVEGIAAALKATLEMMHSTYSVSSHALDQALSRFEVTELAASQVSMAG